MRHKILVSLLLVILCESSFLAQNKYNFAQFGNEAWSFVNQPTQWEGSYNSYNSHKVVVNEQTPGRNHETYKDKPCAGKHFPPSGD